MKFNLFILTLIITSLFSCEKEEGEGGKNDIEGYVMTREIDRNSLLIVDEYPTFEENIYIIYGDNAFHADKDMLSFNGHYSFKKLYKGKYTLFIYSDCLNCSAGKEPLFTEIELKEKKEDYLVDTIFKIKYIN